MSYGRHPYYITREGFDDGGEMFVFYDGGVGDGTFTQVAYDAMAQFVASMWRRDHDLDQLDNLHGELRDLIGRGIEVRPDLADDAYWATRTVKVADPTGETAIEFTMPDPG